MKILLTGAAGFIGRATAEKLCQAGHEVIGVDNLNSYYAVELKHARLATLHHYSNFRFYQVDIADYPALLDVFATEKPEGVIHLAAQAGVRYSIEHPLVYAQSNLMGMTHVLEACRRHPVQHLVYASSSSIYGKYTKVPFSEEDRTDSPVSFYAASKKANELMASSYSHLYGLPITGLRFFTVYGPWGRPDMAPWLFTEAILASKPIKVFNHGKLQRDFTYIDDIVEGVIRIFEQPPTGAEKHTVYNIGNHQPVELMDFIGELEKALGKEAEKTYLPMQEGDVLITYADTKKLREAIGFAPSTPLKKGIKDFVDWYQAYHAEKDI